MKHTVIWLPGAEQELADLWIDPDTRAEVADAANHIDLLLKFNPEQCGESRIDDQRILFITPLGVLFRVKQDDRMVEVIHVWKVA